MMIQYGVAKGAGGSWRTATPGQSGPGRARCGPLPVPVVHAAAAAAVGRVERRRRSAEQNCCVPSGCSRYAGELIDPQDPGDAVKVVCSNPSCVVGSWIHADCYEDWQQRVLFYIRYRSHGCQFNLVATRRSRSTYSYSTLGPVSAWMGDLLRASKLSRYVTSRPGQLSLAIPPWVGAVSTSLIVAWRRTAHASQTVVVDPRAQRPM